VLGLAEQGAAVVLVSSELPELLGMSDRIAVMRQGRLVADLTRDEADQETVMRWATSGK
jgi:inositol transport system ATP-binding protein